MLHLVQTTRVGLDKILLLQLISLLPLPEGWEVTESYQLGSQLINEKFLSNPTRSWWQREKEGNQQKNLKIVQTDPCCLV